MLAKGNMLTAALGYAKRGWPVFPCNENSDAPGVKVRKEKTPYVGRDKDPVTGKPVDGTGGVSKATTDEKQIREWWGKWPNALIGVRLGAEAGLWVLDYDPKGEALEDIERRAVDAVGELPAGPRSKTQSGGAHLWFKWPTNGDVVKNSAKRLANVDWRGEGGYVIVPPSRMTNGNSYEWELAPDVVDFPEAPPGLMDLVMKRGKFAPPKSAPKPAGIVPVTDEAIRRYCVAALDRAVTRVAALPDGQRNQGINDNALGIGHLVGAGGLAYDEAFEALRAAAYAWGIGDDDKALKPGGTLERAIKDGMVHPANLAHVGQRQRAPRAERRQEVPAGYDPETGEELPLPAEREQPPAFESEPEYHEPDAEDFRRLPFRALGYNRENYFYYSDSKRQITILKAKEHTSLQLLQLANLNQWADFIDTRGKLSEEQWKQIANSLIQMCHSKGIFIETNARGRGAWMDGGKVVVHTGDSLRVSGDIVPLTAMRGRYIYEAAEPWEFEYGSPASNEAAHALVEICERLTWVDPISAALLAGWNVVAPVCGALPWRPHIWITGPSRSGKTTAVNDICGRIAGPAAIRFDGKTTEPAIRQKMGFDALPIILDEAESEDQAAVARMQNILDLARVSSSGGVVAKGGQNGRGVQYVARSSFLFSSINTGLKHHADESRVSRLVLQKNSAHDALEHYQELVRIVERTFTPEYAGAMFSRTVANLPTLLGNIETFKTAAATVFRDRRAADQLAPMLAGFYLCHSTRAISSADAEAFIRKHNWSDHLGLNDTSDEMRLFSYLMSRRVRVNVGGAPKDVSVGQAIENTRDDMVGQHYVDALGPRGIRVDWESVTISNTADGIAEWLSGHPVGRDWQRPLAMIEGAEKTKSAVYFAPGLTTRGVVLPLTLLNK